MRRITGERLGMATSLRGVARAHLAMGEFDRASAELEEAIQIGRELNDKPFLVTVLIPYARMLHDLGRTEEAQRAAREAIEECQMDSIQPELLDMPNMAEDVALAHELIA